MHSRKDKLMSKNNTFTVNLTKKGLFSGLYNSIWLHDESLEYELFEYQEKLENKYDKTINVDFSVNFKEYLEKIAEAYINCFETEFTNSKWELKLVQSPMYYNYDTDWIVLDWINAPDNAEERFNNFIEDIKSKNEFNPFDEFEYHTIYDSYRGYEILPEIAIYEDSFGVPIGYDKNYEPILQKENIIKNPDGTETIEYIEVKTP